jgi:hypothetical protein
MVSWQIVPKYSDNEIERIDLIIENRMVATALRLGKAYGVKHLTVRGAAFKIVEFSDKNEDFPLYAKNEKYANQALLEIAQSRGMSLYLEAKIMLRDITKRKKQKDD